MSINFDDLIDGNGQEIYVDLNMIDAEQEWFDAKLGRISYPNIPPHPVSAMLGFSNPLFYDYKEFFDVLYEKGYKIITDSRLVNEETFFFTPCFDQHIYERPRDYKINKYAKIKDCLALYEIFEPFSISFPREGFPQDLPSLPLMLKNENNNGGKEKFIIRTPHQLEIIRRFYNEATEYDKKQKIIRFTSKSPDVIFDENGVSTNSGFRINVLDYHKLFFESMRFQEYIETPTEYNTSLRVLFNSEGEIIASSLKYAVSSQIDYSDCYGVFDRYLSDPESPYYIGSECIVSNTVHGGNSILLGRDDYTLEEKRILLAHDIDPDCAEIPDDVLKGCLSVAKSCNHELGAICGMDFIFDSRTMKWKFLEEHEYPMFYSYCEKAGIPYDPDDYNFFHTQQLIDFELRFKTLASHMVKKHNKEMKFEK